MLELYIQDLNQHQINYFFWKTKFRHAYREYLLMKPNQKSTKNNCDN